MPWNRVEFEHNTTATGTGTLTVYHDSGFSYRADRIQVTVQGNLIQFVTSAKNALEAWETNRDRFNSEKTELLNRLNAP